MPPGRRFGGGESSQELKAALLRLVQCDVEPAPCKMTARGGENNPGKEVRVLPERARITGAVIAKHSAADQRPRSAPEPKQSQLGTAQRETRNRFERESQ